MKVFNKKKTLLSKKKDDLLRIIDASKSAISQLQNTNNNLQKDNKAKIDTSKLLDIEIEEKEKELKSLNVKKQKLEEDTQKCFETWKEISNKNKELLKEQDKINNAIIGVKKVYEIDTKNIKEKYQRLEESFKIDLEKMSRELEVKKSEIENIKNNIQKLKETEFEYKDNISLLNKTIESYQKTKQFLVEDEPKLLAIRTDLLTNIETIKIQKEEYLLQLDKVNKKIKDKKVELENADIKLKELEEKAISRIERERKIEESAEKIKEAYQKAGVNINL
jgi:chromosome segregation ATPase